MLSIVTCGRNDQYGGDFLSRLQLHLSSLALSASRWHLDCEWILVEWNPPPDTEPLAQSLILPSLHIPIRIITVSAALHAEFPNAEKMPIFEYVAKNVGIRRARGDFILTTNADIILSDALIARLSTEKWFDGFFYRVDRYDLAVPIPPIPCFETDDLMAFCAENVYAIQRRDGLLHTNAAGDFLLMSRGKWLSIGGFPELPTQGDIDAYMVDLADRAGLVQVLLKEPIYHQPHAREWAGRPHSDGSWKGERNFHHWGLSDHALPERRFGPTAKGCAKTKLEEGASVAK